MSDDRIYLSSPDIGQAEELAILGAVRSGWIAPLGPDVDAFEAEIAARTEVDHVVALSSGTAALHLALLGIGIGAGDVVLTASMTFAATANAIVYTGAEPYFIDSEEETGNIDPELLEEALSSLRAAGENVKAIVPVDLLGKAANYSYIESIAERYGIPVVSDAAESLGAFHDGKPAGSFGKASVLSFNGNKVMTTSGGGALLTNDSQLAKKTRYLATQARQPKVHYEHTDIGYNYRLSNILAALGRAQLTRLDEMISRRRNIRERYKRKFSKVDGVGIFGAKNDESDNAWLTSIVVDSNVCGWSSWELQHHLTLKNIESRPLWKPMHLQPLFRTSRSLTTGVSERLFENGLTLPSGSSLGSIEKDRIFDSIDEFLCRF